MLAFLLFYRKLVFVHEICGIFWFHIKTENFSVHREYNDFHEGTREFTTLALQAFFYQESIGAALVAKAGGASEIILTTRLSNFSLSGDYDNSCVGYKLKDFCQEPSEFDEWQIELKKFGCAKKRLDIVSPDGKSRGKKDFYAELVPNTNLYFCMTEPLSGIITQLDRDFACAAFL